MTGRSTAARIAAADPEAPKVYAAENAAAASVRVRRFARFADIAAFVDVLVASSWWDVTFPAAPVEVEVLRRSRNATFSAATVDERCDAAAVFLVDGGGWGLETVLHELAHVAAGAGAGHGPAFRAALLELWRREAGFFAAVELRDSLRSAGFAVDLPA